MRTMLSRSIVLASGVAAGIIAGCGPLHSPMFIRPDIEAQKQVDSWWVNMMTPSNRLDRQTLLDALTYLHLYSFGVDRAAFRSEKMVGDLLVIMEVTYDRERPMRDTFRVTAFDREGKLVRDEHYSREDVDKSLGNVALDSRATTQESPTPEQVAAAEALERRKDAVLAATQPATRPDAPKP